MFWYKAWLFFLGLCAIFYSMFNKMLKFRGCLWNNYFRVLFGVALQYFILKFWCSETVNIAFKIIRYAFTLIYALAKLLQISVHKVCLRNAETGAIHTDSVIKSIFPMLNISYSLPLSSGVFNLPIDMKYLFKYFSFAFPSPEATEQICLASHWFILYFALILAVLLQ